MLPEEILRALGWQSRRYSVTCRGLESEDVRDLVGECQALPNLAVAMFALVSACKSYVPGVRPGA